MLAPISNLGDIYVTKRDRNKAFNYFKRALEISEKLGQKQMIGHHLSKFGSIYVSKGDYDLGLDYYEKSLTIGEELGSKNFIGWMLVHIGYIYLEFFGVLFWRKITPPSDNHIF